MSNWKPEENPSAEDQAVRGLTDTCRRCKSGSGLLKTYFIYVSSMGGECQVCAVTCLSGLRGQLLGVGSGPHLVEAGSFLILLPRLFSTSGYLVLSFQLILLPSPPATPREGQDFRVCTTAPAFYTGPGDLVLLPVDTISLTPVRLCSSPQVRRSSGRVSYQESKTRWKVRFPLYSTPSRLQGEFSAGY